MKTNFENKTFYVVKLLLESNGIKDTGLFTYFEWLFLKYQSMDGEPKVH